MISRESLQNDLTDRITYLIGYIEMNMGSYESGLSDEECNYILTQLEELLAVVDTDV
jgi:hypothetical protein